MPQREGKRGREGDGERNRERGGVGGCGPWALGREGWALSSGKGWALTLGGGWLGPEPWKGFWGGGGLGLEVWEGRAGPSWEGRLGKGGGEHRESPGRALAVRDRERRERQRERERERAERGQHREHTASESNTESTRPLRALTETGGGYCRAGAHTGKKLGVNYFRGIILVIIASRRVKVGSWS